MLTNDILLEFHLDLKLMHEYYLYVLLISLTKHMFLDRKHVSNQSVKHKGNVIFLKETHDSYVPHFLVNH